MFLESIEYYEYPNKTNNWSISKFELQNINLIVGLNATGKSRLLRVIKGLADIIIKSQSLPFESGYYKAHFVNKKSRIIYELKYEKSIVVKEHLTIDGKIVLRRKSNGIGRIKNANLDELLEFKIPINQVAVTRRDEIQYPFLELIFDWANLVRYFRFNQELAKSSFAVIDKNNTTTDEFNLKETDKAVRVFGNGINKFGNRFKENVIKDFNKIGYDISNITLEPLTSIKFESNVHSNIIGLHVQEKDLEISTDQSAMSDGMFRALSVLIHINYYDLENIPSCILIDDIGEGLDYDRATRLIKLLISKSKKSKFQLVLTTNDKFIMNNTSLDFWSIVTRNGSNVAIMNKNNRPDIFDEFRFTGLNNFDFFSTGFFKQGFKIRKS
jgi:hypothetical protein